MAEVREGYLGQGRNVQESSSFIMYSVPALGVSSTYPLSTLVENMDKGVIKESQGIDLVARSYFQNKRLDGPYTASTIKKFVERLMEIDKQSRKGAYDVDKFYSNIVNSTNWGSAIKLIKDEDKLNIMKFY